MVTGAPVVKTKETYVCGGHWTSNSNGSDFDCSYGVEFECDECVFVVGKQSGDRRKGKKPWVKKWQWQPKEKRSVKVLH